MESHVVDYVCVFTCKFKNLNSVRLNGIIYILSLVGDQMFR